MSTYFNESEGTDKLDGMSKDKDGTSCKEAIKRWQDANPDTPAHEAIKVVAR